MDTIRSIHLKLTDADLKKLKEKKGNMSWEQFLLAPRLLETRRE